VVQRFSVGPEVWSPGHRGVDLRAAPGSPVLAPAAGVVTFAGVVVDRPVLVLRHPEGHVTSLEPVIATVPVGSEVAAGDPVGRLSPVPGHCAPMGCLHWGERIGGRYVDPLSLLGLAVGPVILLPLRN
jgi:murein DD-endopeptidase MepM/ murein hydrolase activator NlpD